MTIDFKKMFNGVMAALGLASKVMDSKLFKKEDNSSAREHPVQPVNQTSMSQSVTEGTQAIREAVQQAAAENRIHIESLIQQTVQHLELLIAQSTNVIVDKLESDKLEELQARIKNVSIAIRLGKVTEVLPYVFELNGLADYASNRVKEGKLHWLSVCIMSKTMFVAAMEHSSNKIEFELREELQAICNQAKYQILDILVPQIVASNGKVPWDQISTFLSSSPEAPLALDFLRTAEAESAGSANTKVNAAVQGRRIEVTMNAPKGAKVLFWRKRVGEVVAKGEMLVSISMAGREESIYSQVHGKLTRIFVHDGDSFQSGFHTETLIAYLQE